MKSLYRCFTSLLACLTCGVMILSFGVEAQNGQGISDLQWRQDGRFLATAYFDGRIRVTDLLSTGMDYIEFHDIVEGVIKLAWSPDGRRLAVANHTDHKVRVWDLGDAKAPISIVELDAGWGEGPTFVKWSPVGEYLIALTLGLDGANPVFIWQVSGDKFTALDWPTWASSLDVELSSDGTQLALADLRFVQVLGLSTQSFSTRNYEAVGYDIGWSPDGTKIAEVFYSVLNSSDLDGTVRIIDVTTGATTSIFQRVGIGNIAWLMDGIHLVTDMSDGNALIWNAQTGELVNELVLPREGGRWLMAVSPFGGRVAFGNAAPDGALRTEGRPLSPNIEVLAGGYVLMAVPLATEEALRSVLGRCAMEPRSADVLAAKIDPDALSAFIAEVETLPPGAMIPACKADVLAVARAMLAQ